MSSLVDRARSIRNRTPEVLRPLLAAVYWSGFVVVAACIRVGISRAFGETARVDWGYLAIVCVPLGAASLAYGLVRRFAHVSARVRPWLLGLVSSLVFWGSVVAAAQIKNGNALAGDTGDLLGFAGTVLAFGVLIGVYARYTGTAAGERGGTASALEPESDDDAIRYSPVMRRLMWTAPVILAVLAALPLWVAWSLRAGSIWGAAFMGAIGAWFLYVFYLSLRALPYLGVTIHVRDWGVEIRNGARQQRLPWERIGKVRRDDVHQVLWVRDVEGSTVLVLDFWVRGFEILDHALKVRS